MIVPWCARFTPHPDSVIPPHHRSCTLSDCDRFDASQVHSRTPPKLIFVMVFVTCALPTLYVRVPCSASVNARRMLPTTVRLTAFGFHGVELKTGPLLVTSSPRYEPSACFSPDDMEYHAGLPFASYVYSVPKRMLPWWL